MRRPALQILVLALAFTTTVLAGSGELRGRVRDDKGNVVADLLFALLSGESANARELLTTRTDTQGGFRIANLAPGQYAIELKSSAFRPVSATRFEIRPGQSLALTLILQQLSDLLPEQKGKNLDIKTILRSSADNRLILRGQPQTTQPDVPSNGLSSQNATLEWYSASPFGGSYVAFPAEAQGMTTNFAVSQSLPGLGTYAFAGQLNSGNDSLWKVRNFIDQPLGDRANVRFSLGFSRISYDSPELSVLSDPGRLSQASHFVDAVGVARKLSLSMQNSVQLADPLTMTFGMDVDRLTSASTKSFVNPHLEFVYSPSAQTQIRSILTSRRSSRSNTVMLPSGDLLSLADPVVMSKIDDRLHYGGMRFYEAGASRQVTENDWLEVSGFYTDAFGQTSPFVALMHTGHGTESRVLFLDRELARSRGARISYRRQVLPELSAQLSYALARGTGLADDTAAETFSPNSLRQFVERQRFHALTAQLQAHLVSTHTHVTAIVRVIPGSPIGIVDAFADTYDVSNQGVNVFVRQVIPVPDLLGFSPRIEALFDLRNAFNDDVGRLRGGGSDIVFVKNPRSIRGGLAVNF